MTQVEWGEFFNFRNDFCNKCKSWSKSYAEQLNTLLQINDIQNAPVVYNTLLDKITQDNNIRLILIADNPGKNERIKQKYLIGNAGKLAANFFNSHSDLGILFPAEVLILNKTPFYSARTAELKIILKNSSNELHDAIIKSMEYMARATFLLHKTFNVPLWITGYSALGVRGVFEPYGNTLVALYKGNNTLWQSVFLFQHFSMNRFSIDYNNYCKNIATCPANNCSTLDILQKLGKYHKEKIFFI